MSNEAAERLRAALERLTDAATNYGVNGRATNWLAVSSALAQARAALADAPAGRGAFTGYIDEFGDERQAAPAASDGLPSEIPAGADKRQWANDPEYRSRFGRPSDGLPSVEALADALDYWWNFDEESGQRRTSHAYVVDLDPAGVARVMRRFLDGSADPAAYSSAPAEERA